MKTKYLSSEINNFMCYTLLPVLPVELTIVLWLASPIESSQIDLYVFLLKEESKVCLCAKF